MNLYLSGFSMVVGATNVFRGGFYADTGLTDSLITGATFNVYLNNVLLGSPVYVTTTNENGTQFLGVDGRVMEFGVIGQILSVVPEPNVLVMWLSGVVTLWAARRRHRRLQ